MAKMIDKAGIPVAHVATIIPISKTVGANRIVPAIAIPHPLGNPKGTADEDRAARRKLLEKSLSALQTPIESQTIFEN